MGKALGGTAGSPSMLIAYGADAARRLRDCTLPGLYFADAISKERAA